MTTMYAEDVAREPVLSRVEGPYTVRSSNTLRSIDALPTANVTPLVFVVDDDVSVRESLELLIKSAGWQPELFESARDFLSHPRSTVACCLVLDADAAWAERPRGAGAAGGRTEMPIIFMTGYGDVPTTVRAMKAGAVEFLTKPVTATAADAIRDAHRPQPRRTLSPGGDAGTATCATRR